MNLGVGLLVMEILGSLGRSLQIHLVFDADVYFLMMVVVLPPWHGGLQMFLD